MSCNKRVDIYNSEKEKHFECYKEESFLSFGGQLEQLDRFFL
jgi:hypothetical protein